MQARKVQATEVDAKPICSGTYKLVQRVRKDRIVLERSDNCWDKQTYHFDKAISLPTHYTSVPFKLALGRSAHHRCA